MADPATSNNVPYHRSPPLLSNAVSPPRPQLNPVDLRALEYVESYDHNLMCAICYCPFVNPVRLECEHVFCQRCVNDAIKDLRTNSINCPSCRRRIGQTTISPMPKILQLILDELIVKCPLSTEGCSAVVQRCEVQKHVDKYCAYSEVGCPSDDCLLSIFRKDLGKKRCLHSVVQCEDCEHSFMERDLDTHRTFHCKASSTVCPDCRTPLFLRDVDRHVDDCPDAIVPCTAAHYGCNFTASRISIDEHLRNCALSKLMPFLRMQNDRLDAHETELKQLRHKTSILETSFSSIQETLSSSANLIDAPPSSASPSDAGLFDSTAHHLLCLHESLREEVTRVSAAVSDLDAKASLAIMNERLRVREDLSQTNAAITSIRIQLH